MNITFSYLTNRKNPRIEWFIESLHRQIAVMFRSHQIVVVDTYKDERPLNIECASLVHVKPKPCVWQGEFKLTKEDWFAASNARNTALCYAPDGYIVYVDDLSVLMPGWLQAVREGVETGKVICGSYKKVKNLKVENGVPTSYDEFTGGLDSRVRFAPTNPFPCDGGWLYGCSCAIPVEALLTINGWPEDLCDGLGSEDSCCGLALQNAGYQFVYDQRMLTLESEEGHHEEPALIRRDYGVSPNDKSHSALNIALQSKRFPNHTDFRQLRQSILAGGSFPIDQIPEHDWFTKTPLKDL